MKISKIKNVSLEANEEYVFDLVNDLVANSVEDSVYLQVLEDANITIKGKLVDDDPAVEDVILACIDTSDFSVKSAITKAGIYTLGVDGYSSITLKSTSDVDVVIKTLI